MVSIIIPYFNSADYIGRTIASIATQTVKQFECLLIDDGSSDTSFELVNTIIADDGRFKNYRRDTKYRPGGRGAKNFGFSLCKGNYIVFFDSDDVMLPDYLAARINYLDSNPAKHAVITNYHWKVKENDGNNKRIFKYHAEFFNHFKENTKTTLFWLNYLDYRFYYPPGNPMYRREFIENKTLWDETTSIGEDHEYHARLFLQGLDLGYINECTFDYMLNPNSMIATSESVNPLLSRSYGKILVLDNLNKHLGTNPDLINKELVCQLRILRRIVACKSDLLSQTGAIRIMFKRVNRLLTLGGYNKVRKIWLNSILSSIVIWHLITKKGYKYYSLVLKDKNPTFEKTYFTIE